VSLLQRNLRLYQLLRWLSPNEGEFALKADELLREWIKEAMHFAVLDRLVERTRTYLADQVAPVPPREHAQRVLGELAGYASLCWNPRPTGVFDSTLASEGVQRALAKLYAPPEANLLNNGGDSSGERT
jgi:hypothetical protein